MLGIYLMFGILELIYTRLFAKSDLARRDGIVEIVNTFTLLAIPQPMILLAVGAIG